MISPRRLLKAALEAKGWTNQRLIDEGDLKCSAPSVSRKLSGRQALTADEARRMARVLGVRVPGAESCRALEDRLGVTISWPITERGAA